MKIKTIFVENFMRVDARVNLDLGPVTVLVGANGSGKSSVLKAIHWAIRCATRKDATGRTTLEQMDYTPSREFLELAHKKRIQNGSATPKIIVGIIDENDQETIISINAARNEAGTKSSITGPLAQHLTSEEPKTAYIPGLAGLAETETVLATPVLHRKAASGEGGSVLRHVLLELARQSGGNTTEYYELTELNKWVGKVVADVQFWVKFDSLRDVIIDAQFLTADMKAAGRSIAQQRKPLEMAGTGFLQIVQIFAYLLKFKPQLLLIDEPDAHLHPGTQERLIRAIEEAALEFPDTQFILTTHSPSLIRACGARTKVHWMENGSLRGDSEELIRQRMGWGALDKEIILFTEDENTRVIKLLIGQWPELARKVLVWPTFGKNGLPSGESCTKLKEAMGIKVLIHRDRDFMSDSDVLAWGAKKQYTEHNIPLWITPQSDIEAPFCTAEQVKAIFDVDNATAEAILNDTLALFDRRETERDFNTALDGAISSLPADQRSIPTERWRELGEFNSNTIKGKQHLKKLKLAIKTRLENTPDARKLAHMDKLTVPVPANLLCECLKQKIEEAIAQ